MGKMNQEAAVTYTEALRPAKSSCKQRSSHTFNGRFMIYCQDIKLFIPEDFQTETLLKLFQL